MGRRSKKRKRTGAEVIEMDEIGKKPRRLKPIGVAESDILTLLLSDASSRDAQQETACTAAEFNKLKRDVECLNSRLKVVEEENAELKRKNLTLIKEVEREGESETGRGNDRVGELRLLIIYRNCHHPVALGLSERIQTRQKCQVTVIPYRDVKSAEHLSYAKYLVIFILGTENRYIPGSLDEDFEAVSRLTEGCPVPRIPCPIGMKMVTAETIKYRVESMELALSEADFSSLIRILTDQLE